MKNIKLLLAIPLCLLFCDCNKHANNQINDSLPAVDYKYIADNFRSPDALYGVNCWWWWLNGN
ncbi:MAG: hypothetical protein LBK97_05980, partial [Prevotellaceae bacterium]|nr:hypothetical protein [Prevotellaceae bacterium]